MKELRTVTISFVPHPHFLCSQERGVISAIIAFSDIPVGVTIFEGGTCYSRVLWTHAVTAMHHDVHLFILYDNGPKCDDEVCVTQGFDAGQSYVLLVHINIMFSHIEMFLATACF